METWYVVNLKYGEPISKVSVVKHTDKFVTLVKRDLYAKSGQYNAREAKQSAWSCYFPTFDEAKTFALERSQVSVDIARKNLERANGRHGQIKGISAGDLKLENLGLKIGDEVMENAQ